MVPVIYASITFLSGFIADKLGRKVTVTLFSTTCVLGYVLFVVGILNGWNPYLLTFIFNDGVTTKKVALKGSNKTAIITPGDTVKKTLIIAEYMRSARLSSYSRDSDNFMGLKYQTEIKIKIGI
jgi:uncharacterized membrane protein